MAQQQGQKSLKSVILSWVRGNFGIIKSRFELPESGFRSKIEETESRIGEM
jgi:hypothetical protein